MMGPSAAILCVDSGDRLALVETARLIELARLQLDDSLGESDASVAAMLGALGRLLAGLETLSGSPEPGTLSSAEGGAPVVENLRDEAATVIQAMQFYDRLSQRLGHLRDGLAALAALAATPDALAGDSAWSALHQQIRALYANEPDRRLFDAVMGSAGSGSSPPPATDECAGELELL